MDTIVTASEFKAKCLDIFDRVAAGELDRVTITKRGRIVGILVPPGRAEPENVFGCMRGSVVIPADVDLTAPTGVEDFDAESGLLRR
jgi:prevent-host-death family protein